jgi:molybdopterin converting factor small subunit
MDLLRKISDVWGYEIYEKLFDEGRREMRSGVLVVVNERVVQRVDEELADGDVVTLTIAYDGGYY